MTTTTTDLTDTDHAQGAVRKVQVCPVNGVDDSRSRHESNAGLFSADGRPVPLLLLADVRVQVPREAEDVPQHLIGDHVREEPAHVRELAGMIDQGREEVVFKTGGRRLHPAQVLRCRQQFRGQLAEKGIGIGNFVLGVRWATGWAVEHGSVPAFCSVRTCGPYSSYTFGARLARLNIARASSSSNGRQLRPYLNVGSEPVLL